VESANATESAKSMGHREKGSLMGAVVVGAVAVGFSWLL
jgi:hypothetical protein